MASSIPGTDDNSSAMNELVDSSNYEPSSEGMLSDFWSILESISIAKRLSIPLMGVGSDIIF
jgi:hypothetical protein